MNSVEAAGEKRMLGMDKEFIKYEFKLIKFLHLHTKKKKKVWKRHLLFEFSPPFVLRDPRYHHAGIAAAAVETEEHADLLFPPPLSLFVGVGAVQTTQNLTQKILYSH